MTHEEAFLEAILEHPDDVSLRLIFADWLEDNGDPDRAALIRIQLTRERDQEPAGKGYLDKIVALVERNWSRWVAPLARVIAPEPYEPWLQVYPPDVLVEAAGSFHLGFIMGLTTSTANFHRRGAEITSLAPLVRLRLRAGGGHGRDLAQSSALRWIRSLVFVDHYRAPLGPLDIDYLAESPHLPRLSMLSLYGHNLGDAGLEALLHARWVPQLMELDLSDNGLSEVAITALARCERFEKLISLRLDNNQVSTANLTQLSQASWFRRLSVLSVGRARVERRTAELFRSSHPGLDFFY